jgi:predicted ATPase
MKIKKICLKNFKAFKNAVMDNIPEFSVIVGVNGSGKSTLCQLFAFLQESLRTNVNIALNKFGGSKGFYEVRSRNATGNIEIEIHFQDIHYSGLFIYFLSIGENNGKAFIHLESLKYLLNSSNKFFNLFEFSNGYGYADAVELFEIIGEFNSCPEEQTLKSNDILAVKGLAQFTRYPGAIFVGGMIENFFLSSFEINNARLEKVSDYAEHLSPNGENLALVTRYLYNNHPDIFSTILKRLSERVAGINKVEATITEDDRVLIRFKEGSFQDPFLARYVSDGTLKMFAYLVLLYDPKPHPFLCIEEPENQLYHKLLWELAEEFRDYALRGGQVIVTTHSPDFLNAAELDEVFWLVKADCYTTIKRAKNNAQLQAYMADGDQMGYLWKQGFFDGVDIL